MNSPKLSKLLLWLARLWCGFLLVFLLFFIVAHIIDDGIVSYFNDRREVTVFLFFPSLTVIALGISFKWRISGIREEVVRINSVTVKNVNDQMPGIGRILSVLEFWRPPSNSPQTIQNKLSFF